jgi:tRNA1Val (adenine37-N6)-methyltransferase
MGEVFRFKSFEISQEKSAMKVNTDAILLGAWTRVSHAKKALDIGTGTGVIALMLAQRNEKLEVLGIDIDGVTAEEAMENMQNSKFKDRAKAIHCSVQEFANNPDSEKFDLIVSNPPFFSGGTFSLNENKNNVRHTVKLSHKDLLSSVKRLLTPHGQFVLILPYIEGLRFIEIAQQYDLYANFITYVRPRASKNIERLLISFSDQKSKTEESSLVVYAGETGNVRSNEYIKLTQEFYLNY